MIMIVIVRIKSSHILTYLIITVIKRYILLNML